MADFENLEKESFLFAEDLFSDIMSLHPVFRVYLPEHSPTPAKSSHFTRAISKSVMVICRELKNDLKIKYRRDFNSFSKSDAAIKVYLQRLCGIVREITTCKISQILGLSAMLLELIAILYRRGYTFFLSKAPIYWLLMFKNIAFNEFHTIGGWEGLTARSKELEIKYDGSDNEIYWKYWDSDSMPWVQPDQGRGKSSNSTEASSGIVTDFASSSVITVKAGLDTVSKDKNVTDFEVETSSKDPVIPKIPKQTKHFFKEITPENKALFSEEQERKLLRSESRKTLLEKTTVSKDKIETDLEVEPFKDPVIPETPEQTKQLFKKMTPEDNEVLGSKGQEEKLAISKSWKTLLGKKDRENVSSRPAPAAASKKDTVSENESSMSRSSSTKTDNKHGMPYLVQKRSDPKTSKRKTPIKESSSKMKSSSIPSTTPKICSNPMKTNSVTSRSTATAPKIERKRANSMQSSCTKAVTTTSAKVSKSNKAPPIRQGATGTVTSASRQNVSQVVHPTEPEDLNTSAKEKTTKKSAPAPDQKQTSAKRNPRPPKNTDRQWKP